MFILTTAVPGALLPTVRSRCMRLRFGRLTTAEIAAALIRDHDYSDAEAKQTAPIADGSIGQALALVDNDLSMFRELAMGLLQHAAGRADTQSRVQAASALHSGGSKKERTREDVAIVLRLMASMLRDLEAINAGADRAVLANPLLTGDLEALARAYAGDRARAAFGAVDRALTRSSATPVRRSSPSGSPFRCNAPAEDRPDRRRSRRHRTGNRRESGRRSIRARGVPADRVRHTTRT